MEVAIKIAIKNGYADHAYCNEFDMYESYTSYCHSTVCLDPLFWQCLGKGLEWGKETPIGIVTTWESEWHYFIDHLIEGKNINNFFEN